MTRLIDTNELMDWVKNWQKMDHYYHPYDTRNDIPISELEDIIERMPTVEAVPLRHAKLINPHPYGECSICGTLIDIRDEFNYCPHCGAKLDLKED